MRERPILFSAPMISKILAGAKTQTRRIVAHPHIADADIFAGAPDEHGRWEFGISGGGGVFAHGDSIRCPYGVHGDTLWVREEHYRYGHWEAVTGAWRRTRTGRQRWRFVADSAEIRYEAPPVFRKGRHHKDPATPAWHKRLARFMPRSASRITLEVTEVRVQRLQDISEEDARAEGLIFDGRYWNGAPHAIKGTPRCMTTARAAFADLWDSINGRDGRWWSDSPFVWALSFRRVEAR